MERLTGKQAQTLVEAYAAVYTPQELTEEQVWEGVEEWVNALLEEGYDLSDYTWEEMYEAYLSEAVPKPSPVTKPGTPPSSLTTKPADDKAANMAAFAKANPKLAAAAAERARIRGTSQSDNPLMRDMPGKRPMTPSVQSPTLAKDLGKGSGNQSLINNPNASKAAATPAAGNTLSQTVTAASKPTAFSPTPAAGNTLSQTVAAASKPTAFSPTPAATPATPKPSLQDKIKAQRGISSSFDVFDVIKGHLLDEGYADTEEAALAIMTNMSEEWRQSIVEQMAGGPTDSPSDKKTWNKGQTLKDPRAQKIYNKMTGPNPVKLPPA
jgi:hypothetical protein